MGIIKVLPESIANKIAAGEVVDRPASIVKELIENALDAGANIIEVEVRHGGKSLIRIADNGSGMNAEDAELAFQRYATSKISSAEDLAHIGSYGFRGEALPSIAAVSRVKLMTRKPESPEAIELSIEGGISKGVKAASGAKGTVIEVKDLFFNTPARRKFLKSDTTENSHVVDAVSSLALARLDVRFVLKCSDKTVLDLTPGQDLATRASAIFGEDTQGQWLNVQGESRGVKMFGVVGKPQIARANRSSQLFYINKRWIHSSSLSYALQAGFHGLLMHGQYPAAVIFVDCDLERVDVNVHPTKQEVRISNEAEIKLLVKESVGLKLSQEGDLSPSLKIQQTQSYPTYTEMADVRSMKSFFQPTLDSAPAAKYSDAVADSTPSYPVSAGISLGEPIAIRNQLGITKILGQIHHTFIIAETEQGYLVIDQHAAHEKVMFEALMKNFKSAQPASQRLLIDEIVKVTNRQYEILKKSLTTLHKLGFDIEEFGDSTFVVRALPAVFKDAPAQAVLKTYLEEKEDGRLTSKLEQQTEEIAALIACKRKSVKAHDPMSLENIKTLVQQLAQCENPFCCPHGRPTFFKQSFEDLEKQFKRVL